MKTLHPETIQTNDEVAHVDLNFLLTGMMFLAVAGIAGAYALNIEESVKATIACQNATAGFTYNQAVGACTNSTGAALAFNDEGVAITNAQTGIANITQQFGLVGTVIVAIVILGLIFMLFQYVSA